MSHLYQILGALVVILSLVLPSGLVATQWIASTLLSADFNTDANGFTYADDAFGTSQPSYASGAWVASGGYGSTGGLQVSLGGVDANAITGMSGGWSYTLNLAAPETGVSLSFRYRLQGALAYTYDEYSRVLVSLDGTRYGRGAKTYVDHSGGDANFAHDTGWLQVQLFLGDLSAGDHTLILGGFNNAKNSASDTTTIVIDDVLVTSGNASPTASAAQTLVNRLDLNQFKSSILSVATYGDRCRYSTSCAPYTSFNNAQDWLQTQLTAMGYSPQKHNYTYSGWTGSNLYATKVGVVHPDQMYVISAMLDGRGGGQAADDDASGVALVLEAARILAAPDVQTDISVRFLFFDQEEIGLYGSYAYVADRRSLQGIENPAGSGLYPEPTWLGLIQHDMILYDHGVGTRTPDQSPYADLDVEWKAGSVYATQSMALAQNWRFLNGVYSAQYPANSANNSTNTDDTPFQPYTAAISVRENRRGLTGEWINPYYHTANDLYSNYSAADFDLGFNAIQATLGAVAELAGAHIVTDPPADPANLTASAVSGSQINLAWTDGSTNELGFKIERCTGASCSDFAQVATVPANFTSYSDTGLASSTSYSYRVRATNGIGDSAYTNVASATTFTPPAPPSNLTASAVSSSQINLAWTDGSTDELGFKIERCTGASCSNFTQVVTVSANVVTYSNTGLSPSTSYSYRVRAYNGVGDSAYTNVASATTLAPSDTGWLSPSANAATSGGDGNGFEVTPANAYADDGVFAVDNNSGTGTNTSCTHSQKDKHLYYNYNISIPGGKAVAGLEVRLDAKVDATSNAPKMCVQLSWNGGTSWTAAQSTPTLTTAEATYLLGGPANNWGRTWAVGDLSNTNFRVRIINVASSTARDFFADWIAVRVTYQ